MRLPDTAHTSRPWRIHELTGDFRLEDVWALPTPGGPDDFPRLVQWWASSGDPSQASASRAVRTLWTIRWKAGELLGWDGPDAGPGPGRPGASRPAAGGPERGPARPGVRCPPLHLAVPDRRRVGRGDRQPDRSRDPAHRLGPGRDRRLPRPDGRPREAERAARDRLHGRDQAVPAPDRVPADAAGDRAGLAGAPPRTATGARLTEMACSKSRIGDPVRVVQMAVCTCGHVDLLLIEVPGAVIGKSSASQKADGGVLVQVLHRRHVLSHGSVTLSDCDWSGASAPVFWSQRGRVKYSRKSTLRLLSLVAGRVHVEFDSGERERGRVVAEVLTVAD